MKERDEQAIRMGDELQYLIENYFTLECRYQAAIRCVEAKLQNLDQEFETRHRRNPIHSMTSRLKTVPSIIDKLRRKDIPVSLETAASQLTDIAGVRVICSYINDIYTVAELLTGQDDVRLVRRRDYIAHPKPNGYRSLHLVVEVPVYLQEGRLEVPVEIQIRTIAMDFWASLEHELRYKSETAVSEPVSRSLLETARDIAALDLRMQALHDQVADLEKARERTQTGT